MAGKRERVLAGQAVVPWVTEGLSEVGAVLAGALGGGRGHLRPRSPRATAGPATQSLADACLTQDGNVDGAEDVHGERALPEPQPSGVAPMKLWHQLRQAWRRQSAPSRRQWRQRRQHRRGGGGLHHKAPRSLGQAAMRGLRRLFRGASGPRLMHGRVIAYHGAPSALNARSILRDGFMAGGGNAFGDGVLAATRVPHASERQSRGGACTPVCEPDRVEAEESAHQGALGPPGIGRPEDPCLASVQRGRLASRSRVGSCLRRCCSCFCRSCFS